MYGIKEIEKINKAVVNKNIPSNHNNNIEINYYELLSKEKIQRLNKKIVDMLAIEGIKADVIDNILNVKHEIY